MVSVMDDLDRSIARRTASNADYPSLLDAEVRRQRIVAELVAIRKANGLTQTAVAEVMRVRQSVVAEIESARSDIRFSTLDRYSVAVSRGTVELRLVPNAAGDTSRPR
jgi:DNA-binding transcriptional regulator YiaG